jgi:hypothetical protein
VIWQTLVLKLYLFLEWYNIYIHYFLLQQRDRIFKKKKVSKFTLKPLPQTRWESQIENVKAIRFPAQKIRDALLELAESSDQDFKTRSEANSIAKYEFGDFEFLLSLTIWYEVLFVVNSTSKILQSKGMHIDVVINQLKTLIDFFKNDRETGFASDMSSAIEIARELEIELVFQEKLVIRRKRHFDENVDHEITQSVKEYFRIDYFLFIVDQAISSIKQRFEQFHIYEELFGFLFNFEKLKLSDDNSLKDKCLCLESVLTYKNSIDIDGLDLFSELKILREVIQTEENKNTPVDILNYIKKLESFLNACIADKILLIIPITVVSAERTFSKLKLIKSYLRLTMSHERLSGLTILSIEKNMLKKIDYKSLINNFASKKAKKKKMKF